MHTYGTANSIFVEIQPNATNIKNAPRLMAKRYGALLSLKNKTNSTNLYHPTKGYLRETCKSQNINPIYQNLKFTFGIIQIIKKNMSSTFLVLSLIRKYTKIYTISISDLSTQPQRSRVCVNSKFYLACRSTLFPV